MTTSMHKILLGPAEGDLPYLQSFVQAVLLNLLADIMLVDGQIHARNLKDPAERDLLCQAFAKHVIIRFLNALIDDV